MVKHFTKRTAAKEGGKQGEGEKKEQAKRVCEKSKIKVVDGILDYQRSVSICKK